VPGQLATLAWGKQLRYSIPVLTRLTRLRSLADDATAHAQSDQGTSCDVLACSAQECGELSPRFSAILGVGCEIEFKLLPGADTNHDNTSPSDIRPGERPCDY
jgi:hypothetical protein